VHRNLYGDNTPTPQEERVIELVHQGLKNAEIARFTGHTEHVVKNYLRRIFDKLGFSNRVELALWYETHRIAAQRKGT
jgi:DNA-binding NarL/FixJ family response regulator